MSFEFLGWFHVAKRRADGRSLGRRKKVCPHRLAESSVRVAFTARIVFLLCEPGVVLPCIENSPALLICAALAVSLNQALICLLYTSDAADDLTRVELGGGRIIQKKRHRISNIGCDFNFDDEDQLQMKLTGQ